ncbi:MAG: hypothetical protein BMS9Abin05_0902 [Rhodothermia bacterium]|nr:MAG: hypothetical protein BMS9Abin05_0902 [Rhodothermia bacterium]
MKNFTVALDRIHFNRISLDRFTRIFLFPVSVVFAISALVLAIQTYSDLQQSSISSAFATVQSVQEAYRLETEYPEDVVYSPSERRFDRFWIVSESGEVLVTSEENAELSADLWALTLESVDGNILDEYTINGEVFVVAGSNSSDGSYWTIILLSPPFTFTTVVWMIFAILALSLMSVTGVIAIRFLGVNAADDYTATKPSIDIDVNAIEIGGDGSSESVEPSLRPDLSKLHEAVLDATEDFVLVLDSDRKIVYSSLQTVDLHSDESIDQTGLAQFAECHLDEKARSRFKNWVEEGPSGRSLTMDVRGSDGRSHASKWVARTLEMKSGTSFEVFVGRRLMVEKFPGPSS